MPTCAADVPNIRCIPPSILVAAEKKWRVVQHENTGDTCKLLVNQVWFLFECSGLIFPSPKQGDKWRNKWKSALDCTKHLGGARQWLWLKPLESEIQRLMRQPNETSTICHFLAARMAERGCRTNHTMQICHSQQYLKGLRIQTPNSGNRRCSFRDTGQPGGTRSLAVRIVTSTRRSTDMKEFDIGIAMIEACKMRKQNKNATGAKTLLHPLYCLLEGPLRFMLQLLDST